MARFTDVIITIRRSGTHFTVHVRSSEEGTLSRPPRDLEMLDANKISDILYEEVSSETDQTDFPKRLVICASSELLSLHWEELHDGLASVGLRQPFFVLTDEMLQSEAITIRETPIRILVTSAKTDHLLSWDDTRLIEKFLRRYGWLVELTVEKHITKWRLFDIFRNAEKRPFHVWHHVGLVQASPAGLCLDLEDIQLQPDLVRQLISLQHELPLLVIHSLEQGSLVDGFGSLPIRAMVTFRPSYVHGSTQQLMESFYRRLVSHDLSVAVFLARLDLDTSAAQAMDWNSIALLARTTELELVEASVQPVATELKTRILFMRANALEEEKKIIRSDREVRDIMQAMSHNRVSFEYAHAPATRVTDLPDALLHYQPHILHFSGHADDGVLWFEPHAGGPARPVSSIALADILGNHRTTLRCVVLNACFSIELAEAIVQHIDCVVGMRREIYEGAATAFARGFYRAISYGKNINDAFQNACKEIGVVVSAEQADTPQLKIRTGIDPNNITFVPPRPGHESDYHYR